MLAKQFLDTVLTPAVAAIAPVMAHMDSPTARCLLLAIAGQESAWTYRVQKPVGYAHGFWQCEKRGAVIQVVTGGATRDTFADVCRLLSVMPGLDQVFDAIISEDALAYALARLNLWPDPAPLPAIGEEDDAWDYYTRVWKPGKPDRNRWANVYVESALLFAALA